MKIGEITDPRTGLKKSPPYCSIERGDPWPFDWFFGTCGRRGIFFEAK
jgi:hypothetical protein